jgi:hypothetical protein
LRKLAFAFAFFLASCTHWITGTEIRIQVENKTENAIGNFSLLSKTGGIIVLVPENVEKDSYSSVYESQWVGEFNFAIYVGGSMEDLGVHRLKSGSVLARIKEENGKFTLEFK